eukprot:6172606-Pleurochrysis_carterae.AAC.2
MRAECSCRSTTSPTNACENWPETAASLFRPRQLDPFQTGHGKRSLKMSPYLSSAAKPKRASSKGATRSYNWGS